MQSGPVVEKPWTHKAGTSRRRVLTRMVRNETAEPTIIDQLKQRRTYMRTTEVMELLDVTRGTLCGWVRAGTISAVRIGKENKFDPAEVVRYLTARQVTPKQQRPQQHAGAFVLCGSDAYAAVRALIPLRTKVLLIVMRTCSSG